jgi:5-hydroxyisourate hydrolase
MFMAGRLTTHVLDTAQGRPAVHLALELWRLEPQSDERTLLKTVHTNSDGRTDAPLLVDDELQAGVYELVFAVGAYFAAQPIGTTTPPFLDRVPVRFGIADPQAHYHVPLLASPWAYSTYRGS